MTARLVGILGRKQAGKDTAAAGLIAAGYTRRGFADPLKAMALAIDPIVVPREIRLSEVVEARGWEGAKAIQEVRRFLQRLGTEGVREHLGHDAWINAFLDAWVDAGFPNTVAPDVRFQNEAHAIRSDGGVLIRIVRPGQEGGDDHVSEAAADLIPVDLEVVNDGTVEELQRQVLQIVQGWP